jgi:hypothetical protein
MHYQVYVVGEAGIQLELKQAGISYIGGPVLLSPAWPHLSLLITLIWVTALECVFATYHRCQSAVHLVFISVIILNSLFHLLWRLCQEACHI